MFKKFGTAAALSVALLSSAQAGVIVSAVGAEIISGGPGFGNIADTHNLFGLFEDYISGVTDFDTYLASEPIHSFEFEDYEWFSNTGSTSAVVSYDLGSVRNLLGMALWNEDAAGVGSLNILGSTDGVNWQTLVTGASPTDSVAEANYGADVFSWNATNARFIKLEMSNCPQGSGTGFQACGLGEVAFNAAPVPEASTFAMGAIGLTMLGVAASRRRRQG